MIDAYSVPCAPASSASTGPGLAPLTTMTGIDSAASLPAGTSMPPAAVCPGAALAVPTMKAVGWAVHTAIPAATVNHTPPNMRISVIGPPCGTTASGECYRQERPS